MERNRSSRKEGNVGKKGEFFAPTAQAKSSKARILVGKKIRVPTFILTKKRGRN